jgi:hypothetical protein
VRRRDLIHAATDLQEQLKSADPNNTLSVERENKGQARKEALIVEQPQSTRVEGPALLCNQVTHPTSKDGKVELASQFS